MNEVKDENIKVEVLEFNCNNPKGKNKFHEIILINYFIWKLLC